MDINILHSMIRDGLQTGIINFLKEYKLTDLMFLRGSPTEMHMIHRAGEDRVSFTEHALSDNYLNLLQLAAINGHYELVRYILLEHKIFSNMKQTRSLDPRAILINHYQEDDEALTLRLAIQSGHVEIFKLLWDNYPQLYTERHLISVARYCLFMRRYDFLIPLLASPTTTPIFLSSPVASRVEFIDLFDESTLSLIPQATTIIQILGQDPFTRLDK